MVSEHAHFQAISRFSRAPESPEDENDALHRAKCRALIDLLNDLRTPLMMIKSPLQINRVGDDLVASELLHHANRIQSGLEKALEILEMDVTDDGEEAISDLASTTDRYVTSLRPLAERCSVTVQYASEVTRADVRMHPPKLQHLLETAIEGMLRSTMANGRLRITLSADRVDEGSTVILEAVRSTTDAAPLASPYTARLSSLKDPGFPGTRGVSDDYLNSRLALARRHVTQCGGELTADENRCRVTLPAEGVVLGSAEDSAAKSREEGGPSTEASDKKTSVLIVDDHPGTRTYLRYALRKHHRVLEAPDGQAGLEMVREHQPDLVISDIMMPLMDGNELCRAIKADEALTHIPVFLVTANSMPSVRARSLESGADDYLVKPFDVDEAVMRINNEINSRRQLRHRYSRGIVIKPSDIEVPSEEEALIKRATEIVELSMENGDFSVQELAAEIGMSSRQLQRRLREIADQSPVEFIRNLRLQRAAQLLEARFGNVSEVAYRVGFTSLSYFAKCFKEEFGESPSVYRDQQDKLERSSEEQSFS